VWRDHGSDAPPRLGSARRARARARAPQGHWGVVTVLAAVATDGVRALMTVNAPPDTEVFRAFVEEALVPALRPGNVVVCGRLGPHRAPAVAAALEAVGCELRLLPSYSPDFNPTEHCWSKLKKRVAADEPRTREAIGQSVARGAARITPQDCRGWFRHCGYQVASG
jgi:transposase